CRRLGDGAARDHPLRRRRGPDADQQRGGDARPRDRLPATHRPGGGGGMTVARRRSMARARHAIASHPIASYLLIAFGASWAMTGLLSISLLFGLLALFGP